MKGTATKKVRSVSKNSAIEKDIKTTVENNSSKEKVVSSKSTKHTTRKVYLSYNARLVLFLITFIVLFALCLFFARKTLIKENTNPIVFTEQEVIDYKVYLKDNDFYTEKYLPKNKAYVANLIDYIDVDLKYVFHIAEVTKMDVNYKVIAELIIENSNGSNRYFEKEYTIVNSKNKKIDGTNEFIVNENVKIDYDYYNELANKFRSSYGVDTNSYLNIYVKLSKQTDKALSYSISENTKVDTITIPLSQRAIEIGINSSSNSSTRFVTPKPTMKVDSVSLFWELITFFAAAFALVEVIQYSLMLVRGTNKYDKVVNKLLKDYDRLIVEIQTNIDFGDYNVIEVDKFSELLDVRDNLKMPINYYNIAKHEKGIFYIKNNNDIYLLQLKNNDIKDKKVKEIY